MSGSPQDLNRELADWKRRAARLQSLVEVGLIISSSLDLKEVLNLVMEKARKVMEAEICSIMLLNEETGKLEFEMSLGGSEEDVKTLKKTVRLEMGQGVAGWAAQQRECVLVEDARCDERWFTGADKATGFETKSLMAVPLVNKDRLIGVAEVLNPVGKDSFDPGDMELFSAFCSQVAVALDNARFHSAFLAQQRLKEQLAAASSIQRSFLPMPLDEEGKAFYLEAVSLPAQEVGGDLYDYFLLPGRRLAVLIGDVAGKGVGAALLMARVVSEFRYLCRLLVEPGEVMGRLNSSLAKGAREGMFVTASYWLVELDQGLVSFCNCGHIPSLRFRADGRGWEMIESEAGPPLGIVEGFRYCTCRLELSPGDGLLMVTDGLIESCDKQKQTLGGYHELMTRLESVGSGAQILEAVLAATREACEGRPAHDDQTALHLTWTGGGGGLEEAPRTGAAPREKTDQVDLEISLDPKMLRIVRDVAERVARLAGLDRDEVSAFKLAVDEACSNVLRHAYGNDTTRRLLLSFTIGRENLNVTLHDFGRGFDPDSLEPPSPDELTPGGLGLHLIRAVMDDIDYSHSEIEGNTLRLTKKLNQEIG